VGPRKTATSAIQRVLAEHDNSVILYPKAGLGLGGPGQAHGHHGLVFAFFGRDGDAGADIDRLFKSVAEEAKRHDRNLLISAEVLESKDLGAFVRALLSYLESPMEVEILFTCREHFARAASLYNHRFRRRRSRERRSPDEFLIESGAEVCYAPLAHELRETGFRITALNYHPSEDWVQRFLMHVGFSEDNIPEIKNELVSYNPKMLIVNLALKGMSRSEESQIELMKAFKRMPGIHAPSGFIFGRDAAMVAEREFVADRKFLRDQFGIELVPPNLDAPENSLFIGAADFADIVAAASKLGNEGQAVIEFARQYVR
jgi:hypothetical protein